MSGIVVSPPVRPTDGGGILIESSALDSELLRSWVLFWDKIDFPQNNFIGIGHSADDQFLIDNGIMQRTEVRMNLSGSFGGGDVYLGAHLAAFRHNEELEPGYWSLARSKNSFGFPSDETEERRGLLINLTNAIPVPSKDVPMEDIINFKSKRADELSAFRCHLEEIYQDVLAAPDRPLAERAALQRLQSGIEDYIKSSTESSMKLKLADFSARFNFATAIGGTVAAAGLGLEPISALLAGTAAGASLNIGPTLGLKGKSSKNSAYEYAAKIHTELLI